MWDLVHTGLGGACLMGRAAAVECQQWGGSSGVAAVEWQQAPQEKLFYGVRARQLLSPAAKSQD